MTERDYLLVTALQRLRAAKDLLLDARPHSVLPDVEKTWRKAINRMDVMIDELEEEVDEARESGEAADDET